LGIADGTSDGVSDVVTITSRSPLTVLPIDDGRAQYHAWRTLHEMRHTEAEAGALARR
jgi:hypothetical protein